MNPDHFVSLSIVVFCNLPLISLSAEPLWGVGGYDFDDNDFHFISV